MKEDRLTKKRLANSFNRLRPVGTVFESKQPGVPGGGDWTGEWRITDHILADTPDGQVWMERVELIGCKQVEVEHDGLTGRWDYSFMVPISTPMLLDSDVDWSFPANQEGAHDG